MAKRKTFKDMKDNPAMQFISTPAEEEAPTQEAQPEALPPIGHGKPPKGYKLNPLYVEVKSRRVQLILQPSLVERVKAKAAENGLSVNEYISRALDKATREE